MTFSPEQLNFFKFSTVVLDEFPVAIRQVFVYMWDNMVAGVPKWDDSIALRNLFVAKEGGKTKYVPTGKSIKEWDCTALFEATIFAKTFAMPDGTGKLCTLKELYAKSLPSGAFHHTVISSTGDQAETCYLALDQLRLLRNTLCHQISTRKIDKATFDDHLLLTKEAFTALGQSSTRIDEIGKLDEEDFPTARQKHLEDELKEEKDAAIKFQEIEDHLKKIESQAEDVGSDVKDVKIGVTDVKTQVEDVSSDVKEVKTGVTDMKTLLEDLGTDVKNVKTGVTDMKTQVKDVGSHLINVKTRVADMKTRVEDVGSDVKGVKTGITGMKTQVEDIGSDLKDVKTRVKDVKTQVEDVGSDVIDVKTGITDMKTQVEDVGSDVKYVKTGITDMKTQVEDVGLDVIDVKTGVTDMRTQVKDVGSDVKELQADFDHIKQAMQGEGLKGPLFSYSSSCMPDMIPHFIGRLEESQAILDHLTNVVTRLVDIWGPPGFGKTSVAINVAHQLREMGFPVFFTSLRGMKSKDELVSKLLSMFADDKKLFFVSPSHWLIQCLQQLRNPFVLVLDNADDLLESGDAKVKEDVLEFTEEILTHCNHIKLLLTTRGSLDYLSHKLPIHQERVGVLDVASSLNLVQSFLPDISDDDCNTIVTVCGQVPLAIRLMCSIIRDERVSVNELVEELKIAPLVQVLDDASFPDDARLKIIINKSFQRLTDNEKYAFVSLAVFPRWFGIEEATTVLDLNTVRITKKIIRSLERKSLIDCGVEDSECSFTVHSLLRDFVDEKKIVDEAIRASFDAAQRKFHYVNILCFEEANELFFTHHSCEAVLTWYTKSPLSSLFEGVRYDDLYLKVVEVLSKAEVFLYAVGPDKEFLFKDLYDTALKEARKRCNEDDERKLLTSKSFHQIAWFSGGRQSWDSSLYGRYTDAADCSVKLQFYHGIQQIFCGDLDEGIASLLSSVDRLSNKGDHKFLKTLGYVLLACAYSLIKTEDKEMKSHFASLASHELDLLDPDNNQSDVPFAMILVKFVLLACLGPANNTDVTFTDELPKVALAFLKYAGGKSQTVNIGASAESLSNAFDIFDRLSEDSDSQQILISIIQMLLEVSDLTSLIDCR